MRSAVMPAVHGLALLALLLCSGPAHASAHLYRCVGSQGEAVFTQHRAGYRHCHRLVAPDAAPASPAPHAPAASSHAAAASAASAAGSRWRYRSARGGAHLRAPGGHGSRVLRGAVYRVVRADGSVEYTNVRPRGPEVKAVKTLFTYIATCVACNLHSHIDWHTVPLNTVAYADAIGHAARRYGVSRALLRAVIHAESAFNAHAISDKGAQGLMQLMPATARRMDVDDAFDARANIRGGARYLAQLLKAFHGDQDLAVAAYNAGPDVVRKYGGVPPFAETRVYVKRVAILQRRYAQALARGRVADAVAPGAG